MEAFKVIGISIRTTNKDNLSAKDIPDLWNTFLGSNIAEKIPNKISSEIYSIYTDYSGDHMSPYTVILGCRVKNFENVPEGMVKKEIPEGEYKKFLTRGNLNEGIVFQAWQKIWNSNLDRVYSSDFEVYGEKAQNPEDAEVEIFVAVNK